MPTANSSNVIHTAINNGHFHQVRFHIDKGANVNERDELGRTPLILCCLITDSRWSVGLSRLLIENGARISKRDKQGFNALHHACCNQKDELVEVYLDALDCDVHSKCREGNTSLHYAAALGNRVIVKTLANLVRKYKLTLDPTNKRGLTPLHQAFKANQLDCGDLLVECGADDKLLDSDRKSAAQLREEAVERMTILSQRSTRKRPSSKLIRQIKEEIESERPKLNSAKIRVAKDFDLRNDPEYVFKTSAVAYFRESDGRHTCLRSRPKTAIERTPKLEMWKEEIMSLWNHYETKFSNSFRSAAKPLPLSEQARSNSTASSQTLSMMRRNSSKNAPKSRTGSLSQEGNHSRRPSVTSRRSGMPPLVRTQTRSSVGLP